MNPEDKFVELQKAKGVSEADARAKFQMLMQKQISSQASQTPYTPPVKPQSFGEKWVSGAAPQVFIGAGKELLKQADTLSKWGQKGLGFVSSAITGIPNKQPIATHENIPVLKKVNTTPKSGWQKAGGTAVQVGEFMGASGKAATNLAGKLPGLSKTIYTAEGATKVPGLIANVMGQAGTSTLVSTIQEGEINKNVRNTAIVAGALPILSAGVRGLFGPEKLIQKASGLSNVQTANLDKIATIKNRSTGQANYKGIKDWMLQKFTAGGRGDLMNQADDLYNATKASKSEALKAIKAKIPNTSETKQMLDILKSQYGKAGKYGGLGNEAIIKELNTLAKAKSFTATQFDRIRYLLDDMLPSGAYKGSENAATAGIENVIDRMRSTLAKLDPTGQIAKQNVDKMILMQLSTYGKGLLKKASFKNVFTGLAPGGITASAGKYLLGGVPGMGALATGVGAIEMATSIPTVASHLARGIYKTGQKLGPTGVRTLKDILRGGLTEGGKKLFYNK